MYNPTWDEVLQDYLQYAGDIWTLVTSQLKYVVSLKKKKKDNKNKVHYDTFDSNLDQFLMNSLRVSFYKHALQGEFQIQQEQLKIPPRNQNQRHNC